MRTCDDGDTCAESGALRWSRPLLDPYRADVEYGDYLAIRPVVTYEHGDATRLLADDDTVYFASGTQLLALDAATGKPRWSHRYPKSAVGGFNELRMVGGRLLVAQSLLGEKRQYLSVDPRTGDRIVIPVRDGENDLLPWGETDHETPRDELILSTAGFWGSAGADTVRSVDPTTGRTSWRTKLGQSWQKTVRDGVLYLDDYRERADIPKNREQRHETRAIQRVDLRTGKRLPDIELPKKLWGKHHMAYVTKDETIVLEDAPIDGGAKYAVDENGRQLDQVPADEPERERQTDDEEPVRAEGPDGKVQRLVGYKSGAKRWTGPRMMAPGEMLRVGTTPRLAVALACAPDGIEAATLTSPFPGVRCTKPRVFAVTW